MWISSLSTSIVLSTSVTPSSKSPNTSPSCSVAWIIGWALILEYTIGGSAVARGISPNLAMPFGGGILKFQTHSLRRLQICVLPLANFWKEEGILCRRRPG